MKEEFSLIWGYISNTDILIEKKQCIEEGKDISKLDDDFLKYSKADVFSYEMQEELGKFLDTTYNLPTKENYKYVEPSDYDSIIKESKGHNDFSTLEENELRDKVAGAWYGRIAACNLGKPFEGAKKWQIEKYLTATNNFPPTNYFTYLTGSNLLKECNIPEYSKDISQDTIKASLSDDDLNYPVLALNNYEKYKKDITASDFAQSWLEQLPYIAVCTAERVAYKNFINNIEPPKSACHRNIYRELIGAQIRGDFWGWINPKSPVSAAKYAFLDASISHVKNGIYGEMWVAAMLSAAFHIDNMEDIIKTGLNCIPTKSRLHESINNIINMYKQNKSYEEIIADILSRWDENDFYDWCHTISNAEICAASLLCGENDFTKTIGYSIMPGFDTDCNGATCGSIIGTFLGAKNIPKHWHEPLNDTLYTNISGNNIVKITDLVTRTLKLVNN